MLSSFLRGFKINKEAKRTSFSFLPSLTEVLAEVEKRFTSLTP